ncbi:hypothetical protein L7F22_028561 [Adiantum nelumboides]|nr:hypothetical protein [Adiantum nelumboides]
MNSIRAALSLVAAKDMHLEQMDMDTTFLNGNLEEEIYMKQPQGHKVKGKEQMVCKLKKSLYGLKQGARKWYKKADDFMLKYEFTRCSLDHCVYTKKVDDKKHIILLLYVDDMLIAGDDMKDIQNLKTELSESFSMKDLGAAKCILGMKISRNRQRKILTLSQEDYIEST